MQYRHIDNPLAVLARYDVILVNSSGGKDSQAQLDLICRAAKQQDVLDRVVVVHCDLGRVEWKRTREIAEEQARCYGVRFEVVSRTKGDLLEQAENERRMFPDKARKWCTSDQKTAQVTKLFTQLVSETRVKWGYAPNSRAGVRPVRILNCLGMRAQESTDRKALAPVSQDKASNGRREITRYLPIHGWTTDQVFEAINAESCASRDHVHYAYALGMSRVSCCFCIMASKNDLMIAARHNPELLDEYVRVETKLGHKFRQDLAMADIKAAIQAEKES